MALPRWKSGAPRRLLLQLLRLVLALGLVCGLIAVAEYVLEPPSGTSTAATGSSRERHALLLLPRPRRIAQADEPRPLGNRSGAADLGVLGTSALGETALAAELSTAAGSGIAGPSQADALAPASIPGLRVARTGPAEAPGAQSKSMYFPPLTGAATAAAAPAATAAAAGRGGSVSGRGGSVEKCGVLFDKKVADGARTLGILPWVPQENKYLLMYCVRGQISNRMECIHKHLLVAGLLNRTLLVPPLLPPNEPKTGQTARDPPYDLRALWDLDRTRACYGNATVMSTLEYEERTGMSLAVDAVRCWHGPHGACPLPDSRLELNCPATVHRKTGYALRGHRRSRVVKPVLSADCDRLTWGTAIDSAPLRHVMEGFSKWRLDVQWVLSEELRRRKRQQQQNETVRGDESESDKNSGRTDNDLSGGMLFDIERQCLQNKLRPTTACLPSTTSLRAFLKQFASLEARVLLVGDLILTKFAGADVPVLKHWGSLPFRRSPTCPSGLSVPPPAALEAKAEEIVRSMGVAWEVDGSVAKIRTGNSSAGGSDSKLALSAPFRVDDANTRVSQAADPPLLTTRELGVHVGRARFLAAHWRRRDLALHCLFNGRRKTACFYSPEQSVECISAALHRHNLSHLYLATDAPSHEMRRFRAAWQKHTRGIVQLHHLPHLDHTWLKTLPFYTTSVQQRLQYGQQQKQHQKENAKQEEQKQEQLRLSALRNLLQGLLDKLVASRALSFLGTLDSTFSKHIQRMRYGLATASCADSTICYGKLEWGGPFSFEGLPSRLGLRKKRMLQKARKKARAARRHAQKKQRKNHQR